MRYQSSQSRDVTGATEEGQHSEPTVTAWLALGVITAATALNFIWEVLDLTNCLLNVMEMSAYKVRLLDIYFLHFCDFKQELNQWHNLLVSLVCSSCTNCGLNITKYCWWTTCLVSLLSSWTGIIVILFFLDLPQDPETLWLQVDPDPPACPVVQAFRAAPRCQAVLDCPQDLCCQAHLACRP